MTARLESVLNQVLPVQATELLAAEPYERAEDFTYDTVQHITKKLSYTSYNYHQDFFSIN